MKVFVAGATGVVGRRLIPLLVERGYDVVGMSRSQERAGSLADQGARGVVANVYDTQRLRRLLADEKPEIVIHELTDIPKKLEPGRIVEQFAANRRIRIEGTRNLVEAARVAGARRIVAQSYAHVYAPRGSWAKAEWEALDLGPDTRLSSTCSRSESWSAPYCRPPASRAWRCATGRCMAPEAPSTTTVPSIRSCAAAISPSRAAGPAPRRSCTSTTPPRPPSWHSAVRRASSTSATTEPASLKEWLPFYARLVGAPPPRHIPALAERVLGNEHLAFRSTRQRGADNAKARARLGFAPAWVSWRDGLRSELVRAAAA